jgi:hypothetical protein
VLEILEKMHAHLTAAVVSNDPLFLQVRFLNYSNYLGMGYISMLVGLPSYYHIFMAYLAFQNIN